MVITGYVTYFANNLTILNILIHDIFKDGYFSFYKTFNLIFQHIYKHFGE